MDPVRAATRDLVAKREVVVMQRGKVIDIDGAVGPIRIARADIAKATYADAYRGIDFRAHPEQYRIGRGEEGVLVAEPYKTELLPLWRFKTPAIARASARALWSAFVGYRRARDFVGMDMARKYLQMGFTRARRYANHRSGRKYVAGDVGASRATRTTRERDADPVKAESAAIFYDVWQRAERDRVYAAWRKRMRTVTSAARSSSSSPSRASSASRASAASSRKRKPKRSSSSSSS